MDSQESIEKLLGRWIPGSSRDLKSAPSYERAIDEVGACVIRLRPESKCQRVCGAAIGPEVLSQVLQYGAVSTCHPPLAQLDARPYDLVELPYYARLLMAASEVGDETVDEPRPHLIRRADIVKQYPLCDRLPLHRRDPVAHLDPFDRASDHGLCPGSSLHIAVGPRREGEHKPDADGQRERATEAHTILFGNQEVSNLLAGQSLFLHPFLRVYCARRLPLFEVYDRIILQRMLCHWHQALAEASSAYHLHADMSISQN
mmetsp:Transcript_19769/g.46104  ORF Transcript_19769/g.46104 Transcript_19769/m.46104 type:complete len:259 (+) Transcript_19769:1678-2454(+)